MRDPVADGSPGAFAQRSSPVPEVLHKRSSINNSIQRTRIPLGITSVLNEGNILLMTHDKGHIL